VQTVASQGPGQARASIGKLFSDDQIFALDEGAVFNPQRNSLLINIRYDDAGGLVGIYTLEIKCTNVAEGMVVKDPKYMPPKLASWVGSKLGVKV
jgi:hypothetical protein